MIKYLFLSMCMVLAVGLTAQPAMAESTQNIVCKNIPGTDCTGADKNSADKYVKIIVNSLLLISGIAAVVMMVVGGIRYVTSAGNQDAITGARRTIIYALLGLVLVILAKAIVNFVLKRLF